MQATDSGPLLELERLVTEVQAERDLLNTLGYELAGLFRKLPAEYRRGNEALDPANPTQLRHIVDQAHALLLRGLKKEARDA